MNSPQRGDFVEMDGLLAVVVATDEHPDVPHEHVGLWFGAPATKRVSEGGTGGANPEVSTVPVEYCTPTSNIEFTH